MSGRHLRRDCGSSLRRLLAVLGVLVVGALLGAGGSLLLEDRSDDVATQTGGVAGDATLTPQPGPITIALAGDVAVDGLLRERLDSAPGEFVGPLSEVLAAADLSVVDLDAALSAYPAATDDGVAPVGLLAVLGEVGVDVVSLANDRSLGLGSDVLEQAVAVAPDAPALIGFGPDEGAAYRPFVREVGGHTVAVIAATQVLEPERIATDTAGPDQAGVASAKRVDRLVAEVEAARAAADTVVVYLHWGTAGERCPTTSQQELADALVAAGADVVAGPGSGRVQGAGRSGTAAVAYGLGSFLVDDPDDDTTGVLLVRIDGRDVLELEWVPARRTGGVPEPLEGEEVDAAVAEWESRRGCTGLTP
jgi:poly-gamma-glutamate capsule biosynthesis protein CapA/YwtB (metallophosphatase superfamily)